MTRYPSLGEQLDDYMETVAIAKGARAEAKREDAALHDLRIATLVEAARLVCGWCRESRPLCGGDFRPAHEGYPADWFRVDHDLVWPSGQSSWDRCSAEPIIRQLVEEWA